MTTLETLKAARAKIADPQNWTQGFFAIDARYREVDPLSPEACKWCAQGSLRAVTKDVGGLGAYVELGLQCSWGLITFNDTHTHAEVLALFDKAIASLEAA